MHDFPQKIVLDVAGVIFQASNIPVHSWLILFHNSNEVISLYVDHSKVGIGVRGYLITICNTQIGFKLHYPSYSKYQEKKLKIWSASYKYLQ